MLYNFSIIFGGGYLKSYINPLPTLSLPFRHIILKEQNLLKMPAALTNAKIDAREKELKIQTRIR